MKPLPPNLMSEPGGDRILHQTEAFLWDGKNRLLGQFFIYNDRIEVEFGQFANSHLFLRIPKENIQQMREFLLFGVSRNGLAIRSTDGREDQFIVNDPSSLRTTLKNWLADRL